MFSMGGFFELRYISGIFSSFFGFYRNRKDIEEVYFKVNLGLLF